MTWSIPQYMYGIWVTKEGTYEFYSLWSADWCWLSGALSADWLVVVMTAGWLREGGSGLRSRRLVVVLELCYERGYDNVSGTYCVYCYRGKQKRRSETSSYLWGIWHLSLVQSVKPNNTNRKHFKSSDYELSTEALRRHFWWFSFSYFDLNWFSDLRMLKEKVLLEVIEVL